MKKFKNLNTILLFSIFVLLITSFACNEASRTNDMVAPGYEDCDFLLLAKKHSLNCFPGESGKFDISILPGSKITTPIKLSIEADPCLKAKLSKTEITEEDLSAYISFCTRTTFKDCKYTIIVKADYNGKKIQIPLNLEVIGSDKVVKEPC
ncbi:hypothetical protein D9V86_02720 [Bacteroidetes/Chlorobi group bacterium ChocPot_Mid]|nr:MAG: hypothetical protein D9V86_02720 [Bacteroidetes/Chlorobi group bacterium ChocPot_Mid]